MPSHHPPTTVWHARLTLSPSSQHHCFRRILPALLSRGSLRKEGITHSPGHTQPSFSLDPIRTGNHQRRGMPRFDAEPPAESARRQGIRPCTAQNLRLPPTTVETKIRPAGLLARLRTNELSTAHGIPCPGFRPGSLDNRGLPARCREINSLQPPPADIECCDPFR